MYSSIEISDRPLVIEKCYWPLLALASKGFSVGIEAPGITLELINQIDGSWTTELKRLMREGKVEFIGSGYAQVIGPLVPSAVNDWNQRLGIEVYETLLGARPSIALINEMAYSGGIAGHYTDNGYSGIIMEWNNPRKYHPEWNNEWRFYPQRAVGADNKTVPVIWSDSIAFQKFQRYAHGEFSIDEYIEYIKSQAAHKDRYFPLYTNDVEIFDFRPGRYKTEAKLETVTEWGRIEELFRPWAFKKISDSSSRRKSLMPLMILMRGMN